MISDCLGVSVYRFKENELGILGIYRLLCEAMNIKAADAANETDEFLPNKSLKSDYEKLYNKFADLKNRLLPYWEQNKI